MGEGGVAGDCFGEEAPPLPAQVPSNQTDGNRDSLIKILARRRSTRTSITVHRLMLNSVGCTSATQYYGGRGGWLWRIITPNDPIALHGRRPA